MNVRKVEEGEGSIQVGELRAVVIAVKAGAQSIYTDSYTVAQAVLNWVGLWEANNWIQNRKDVWRKGDWQYLLQ